MGWDGLPPGCGLVLTAYLEPLTFILPLSTLNILSMWLCLCPTHLFLSYISYAACPNSSATFFAITGSSGEIFMGPYDNYDYCSWLITSPPNTVIYLTVVSLDTECG